MTWFLVGLIVLANAVASGWLYNHVTELRKERDHANKQWRRLADNYDAAVKHGAEALYEEHKDFRKDVAAEAEAKVAKLQKEVWTLAFKLKLWKGLAKGYKKRLLPLLGNQPKGENGPLTPEQQAKQAVVDEVIAEVYKLVPASDDRERRRLIAWALGEIDGGRDSDEVLIELRRGDTSLSTAEDDEDGE
jgi:hypothetical protein